MSGPTAQPVIRADGVTIVDARGVTRVERATFAVDAGEIVGVAAAEGEGERELLRAIAGRLSVSAGRLEAPADVGFIPEDRNRDALVPSFPVYQNMALRGAGARRGRLRWRELRSRTRALLERFDVRGGSETSRASALSGGNQQKVVLARELSGALPGEPSGERPAAASREPRGAPGPGGRVGAPPAAIVAENPTRGLDIQATAAVHAALREAAAGGAAVVVYASDIDEVLSLADRVLVLAGRVVREVVPERDAVGRAMLGVDSAAVVGPVGPE